jgi:hypothetical protein
MSSLNYFKPSLIAHHSIGRWNPVSAEMAIISLDSNFRWNDEQTALPQ